MVILVLLSILLPNSLGFVSGCVWMSR